jgi:hypothetical protein
MRFCLWPAALLFLLAGCAQPHASDSENIEDIVISGFQSQESDSCRPSDVPLDQKQVWSFFQRATSIDSRTLHDNYEWAPCYLEGTLKYRERVCTWQVRAGGIGVIECPAAEQYFACKECDDLFLGTKH